MFWGRKSQKNILTKTKLFSTEIVMIQLKTIVCSHLTDFPLENPMFLSIFVLFLHFPGIPGKSDSKIARILPFFHHFHPKWQSFPGIIPSLLPSSWRESFEALKCATDYKSIKNVCHKNAFCHSLAKLKRKVCISPFWS